MPRPRIRELLRRAGIDARRYRTVLGYDQAPFVRRCRLLALHDIGQVVDVGANEGQWALSLRRSGFPGEIVSIEPLRRPFEVLAGRARGDPHWHVQRCALAERDGTATMHVAHHDAGSSLLRVSPRLVENTPQMAVVGDEQVELRTLASIVSQLNSAPAMLKLDVQGAESRVLAGAGATLARFRLIEAELSFEPLYEGELPFREMIDLMAELGFEPVAIDLGIADERTGFPIQVDVLFAARGAVDGSAGNRR